MAFDKEELQQLKSLLDEQRVHLIGKMDEQRVQLIGKMDEQRVQLIGKMDDQRIGTMSDVRSLLQPIKDDLAYLKHEIKDVKKMAVEDVEQAFGEIERLKKKVKQLDLRLATLEH